jgi:hypothetical protein
LQQKRHFGLESLDRFDRLLPQPAPLPTNPTVAHGHAHSSPGADVAGVGPCLAQIRNLNSVLQLEQFELRPVD